MKKIYIEITDKCNLNCKICYRKAWNTQLEHMDTEILSKICKEIREDERIKEIVLGGNGESTGTPLIYKAIEELKDYHLTITTNAVYLTDNMKY